MRTPAFLLTLCLAATAAQAQQQRDHLILGEVSPANVPPRVDLSFGFDSVRANAPPPNGCTCFGITGGALDATYHLNEAFAITGQFTASHAGNISALGQNLTLMTYMAGPRVTIQRRRLVPFSQILFGIGHGSDSYFPSGTTYTTSASSFAYEPGGGLDINLSPRLAVRALEANYLHTDFPNGTSNFQHHLVISAGVVLKLGVRRFTIPVQAFASTPPPPPGDMEIACSARNPQVQQGQDINLAAQTTTKPEKLDVIYTWMPDAGMIVGTGREVKFKTETLMPGDYTVRTHAAVTGDYHLAADCDLTVTVTAPPPLPVPPPVPAAPPVDDAARQRDFHQNVLDAFFEYDKATLVPSALEATLHAADFLNRHPDMQVRVEGFADERGSIEYNLILGQQRAVAARNALIQAGVQPDRIEIISYGKAAAVCTEATEACYRQNRRAAFSLHP